MVANKGEELFLQGQIDEALPVLEKEGQKGLGRSLYLLGTIYREGYGHVVANEEKAETYFQAGKQAGDALCDLSMFYAGASIWDTVEHSFRQVLQQAVAGDVISMEEVGRFYRESGIVMNPEEGFKWLTKGALFEYWRALYDLGNCYANAGDSAKAAACYEKAAAFGDKYSEYALGQMGLDAAFEDHDKDKLEKALAWLEKAISHGSGEAASLLGELYLDMKYDDLMEDDDPLVKPDETKAMTYLKQATDLGDETSAQLLAGLYDEKGNKKKAEKYYKESIRLGNNEAQVSLGMFYLEQEKYTDAFRYLKKAADQGLDEAQYLVACMYANGQGVEKDHEKAMEWMEEAADNGNEEALAQMKNS